MFLLRIFLIICLICSFSFAQNCNPELIRTIDFTSSTDANLFTVSSENTVVYSPIWNNLLGPFGGENGGPLKNNIDILSSITLNEDQRFNFVEIQIETTHIGSWDGMGTVGNEEYISFGFGKDTQNTNNMKIDRTSISNSDGVNSQTYESSSQQGGFNLNPVTASTGSYEINTIGWSAITNAFPDIVQFTLPVKSDTKYQFIISTNDWSIESTTIDFWISLIDIQEYTDESFWLSEINIFACADPTAVESTIDSADTSISFNLAEIFTPQNAIISLVLIALLFAMIVVRLRSSQNGAEKSEIKKGDYRVSKATSSNNNVNAYDETKNDIEGIALMNMSETSAMTRSSGISGITDASDTLSRVGQIDHQSSGSRSRKNHHKKTSKSPSRKRSASTKSPGRKRSASTKSPGRKRSASTKSPGRKRSTSTGSKGSKASKKSHKSKSHKSNTRDSMSGKTTKTTKTAKTAKTVETTASSFLSRVPLDFTEQDTAFEDDSIDTI